MMKYLNILKSLINLSKRQLKDIIFHIYKVIYFIKFTNN